MWLVSVYYALAKCFLIQNTNSPFAKIYLWEKRQCLTLISTSDMYWSTMISLSVHMMTGKWTTISMEVTRVSEVSVSCRLFEYCVWHTIRFSSFLYVYSIGLYSQLWPLVFFSSNIGPHVPHEPLNRNLMDVISNCQTVCTFYNHGKSHMNLPQQ